MWFYSGDHEPPHFHTKRKGEWEARVWFMLEQADMIEICWSNKTPSSKELKVICELAEQHRVALQEQWDEIHGN